MPEASPQSLRHSNSMEPPGQSVPGTPRFHDDDDRVIIEPLPDITVKRSSGNKYGKPMDYNHVVNKGLNVDDWFHGERMTDFPRNQLAYVKELGYGWFGHVVEGEATKIVVNSKKSKVFVKILREDLSSVERAFALHGARKHRDLKQENICVLLGKSFEKQPYLLIYEFCPKGDLKQFLIKSRSQSEELIQNGILLKICCDVASAVSYCHQNEFIINDLACRNFYVAADASVKLGDCEVSMDLHKDDYLAVGDISVPIRWTAPDSIDATDSGQIVTKELTKAANVWTFGVVFWEILEFAKKPYIDLTNDDVIEQVIRRRSAILPEPLSPVPLREKCYQTMQMCWKSPSNIRPTMANVLEMVSYINSNQKKTDNFESKWNSLLPTEKLVTNLPCEIDSASPVPADPMIVKATTPNSANILPFDNFDNISSMEINQSSAKINQTTLKNDQTPTKTEPVVASTISEIPDVVETYTVEKSQPINREAELERIDKRNFILTLNDDELSALKNFELVQFYEYLSKNEIEDLERRHAKAVDDSQARSRDTFLTMSLDEMNLLPTEELQKYVNLFDEKEKLEINKNLLMNKERNRIFALDSQALAAMDDDAIRKICESLNADDAVIFRQRINSARDEKLGRQNALTMIKSTDIELSLKENRSDLMKYLTPDESSSITNRLNDFHSKRNRFLTVSDEHLINMTDEDFENQLQSLLYPDETASLRDRRSVVIDNRRYRDEILNADDRKLYQLLKTKSVDREKYLSTLTDDENRSVVNRLENFEKIRNDILSGNGDNYDDHTIGDHLDQEEIEKISIDNRKRKLLAMDGLEFRQQFQLIDETILNADEKSIVSAKLDDIDRVRNRFLNRSMDFYEVTDGNEFESRRNFFTDDEYNEISSKILEGAVKREKIRQQVLSADHLDLYLLSVEGLEPYMNYLDEKEVLAVSHRLDEIVERRKNFIDNEMNSLEEDEILSEYFTDEEIADLKKRRNQKLADNRQKSVDDQRRLKILNSSPMELSKMKSIEFDEYRSILSSDDFENLSTLRREALEAREGVLSLTDVHLRSLSRPQLERYYKYLTNDEIADLENRYAVEEIESKIESNFENEFEIPYKNVSRESNFNPIGVLNYEKTDVNLLEMEPGHDVFGLVDDKLKDLKNYESFSNELIEDSVAETDKRHAVDESESKTEADFKKGFESPYETFVAGQELYNAPKISEHHVASKTDFSPITVLKLEKIDENLNEMEPGEGFFGLSDEPLRNRRNCSTFLLEDIVAEPTIGEIESKVHSNFFEDFQQPTNVVEQKLQAAVDKGAVWGEPDHGSDFSPVHTLKYEKNGNLTDTEPRQVILGFDEAQLRALSRPQLEKYFKFLTVNEIAEIEKRYGVNENTKFGETKFHPFKNVVDDGAVTTSTPDDDEEHFKKFKLPANHYENSHNLPFESTESPIQSLKYEKFDDVLTETEPREEEFLAKNDFAGEEKRHAFDVTTPPPVKLPRRVERLSLSSDVGQIAPSATAKDMDEFNESRRTALNVTDEALAKMSTTDVESFFQFLSPDESLKLQERKHKLDGVHQLQDELSTRFFEQDVPPLGTSSSVGLQPSSAGSMGQQVIGASGLMYDEMFVTDSPTALQPMKLEKDEEGLNETEKSFENFLTGQKMNVTEPVNRNFGESYVAAASEDESIGRFDLDNQNLPEFRDYLKMGPTLSMLSSSVDQSSEDERNRHGPIFEQEQTRNEQILDFDSFGDSSAPTVENKNLSLASELNELFGPASSLAAPEINLILPTPSVDSSNVSPVWPLTRDPEGLVHFDYSTPIADIEQKSKITDSERSAYVSAMGDFDDDPFGDKNEFSTETDEIKSKNL